MNTYRLADVPQEESPPTASEAAVLESRFPILIWVVLVYLAALAMQVLSADLDWLSLLFFSGLAALHLSMYWQASALAAGKAAFYFTVQALLVYGAAYLVPLGSPAVLIGLYSVLIGQGVGVWPSYWKVAALSICCYALSLAAFIGTGWMNELVILIPILILMNVVVVSYGVLYFRQVYARSRTQSFLRELEQAHRKVEELTLVSERQRMARDLHDTLAQGLAGLLMQLDAADAHLSSGNTARAQQIVRQSMGHARATLTEARRVIDDLRADEIEDHTFHEMIERLVHRLTAAAEVETRVDISELPILTGFMKEHCAYIIGESISNALKHASASRISVKVEYRPEEQGLLLDIVDDGKGFNSDVAKRSGHYGLVGIRERVRLMGGTLSIESDNGSGTSIRVEVPCGKGEEDAEINIDR